MGLAKAGDPGALDVLHRGLNNAFRSARTIAKEQLYKSSEFGSELRLKRQDYQDRIQERYEGLNQ